MKIPTNDRALRTSPVSRRTARLVVGVAVAGLFVAACGKSSPSSPSTAGPLATITLTPTTVTLPAGAPQQYTAVGKDANGNVVVISPTWSVVARGGPKTSPDLFTAGATGGTVTNTVDRKSVV